MTAIVLSFAIVIAAAIGGLAYVIAAKKSAGPTRELANAVRVLDRVLAYDDAVTCLSSELRDEASRVVRQYQKELP